MSAPIPPPVRTLPAWAIPLALVVLGLVAGLVASHLVDIHGRLDSGAERERSRLCKVLDSGEDVPARVELARELGCPRIMPVIPTATPPAQPGPDVGVPAPAPPAPAAEVPRTGPPVPAQTPAGRATTSPPRPAATDPPPRPPSPPASPTPQPTCVLVLCLPQLPLR